MSDVSTSLAQLRPILQGVDASGPGPDAPLFSEALLSQMAAVPGAEEALLHLVRDTAAGPATRFVAAEALMEGDWIAWRSNPADRQAVAAAMAGAIAADGSHNRWGLPGQFVGPYGRRLLALGADADGALAPLLRDQRPLQIEGSEAATLNGQAKFRLSDLAAWLIAARRQISWEPCNDPSVRDQFIAGIQRQLGAR